MDQISAYALLADKLNQWRAMPRNEVTSRVGAPKVIEQVFINGEPVSIEVTVNWVDSHRARLLVTAVAYGPSHWKMERLQERIILELVDVAKS